MRTSSSPTSRKRSASQAPRADSPNGGAAIRAISACQWVSCGSWVRNQLNADRTSGDAARRATSWCNEGTRSGMSARGGTGLMGVMATSYNAWEEKGIGKCGDLRQQARRKSGSQFHCGYQLFCGGDIDAMALRSAEDWARDRVEFR